MTDGFTGYLNNLRQDALRKRLAWEKAAIVTTHDPDRYRKDAYGTWIEWAAYGTTGQYGWEIDHELPKAHYPYLANATANLRALNWRNNRAKSDKVDVRSFVDALYGYRP